MVPDPLTGKPLPTDPPSPERAADEQAELDVAVGQELRVAAPMLAAARDHLGERLAIHVIGGMQVSGRLYAIDEDDGTLVVTSGENTYHVALHAVAVLVTS